MLSTSTKATLRRRALDVLDALHLLKAFRELYNRSRSVFNLKVRLRNARFRRSGAAGRIPMQPPTLIHFVSGVYDMEAFYHNGKEGAAVIVRNLAKHGLSMERFAEVLDFGCGCGRILRHWEKFPGVRFFGTDYNPLLVQWCNDNLPFVRCSVNSLSSKLPYDDQRFDFVYAISVFTHLTEKLQFFWIDEIHRVLKSRGYCYVTVNGLQRLQKLTAREREAFFRGELVVQRELHPGTNTCHSYHPESYFRKHLTKGFEVIDFTPEGQPDAARQDVFLLRKQ